GLRPVGILPRIDDVERHVHVLQPVGEALDRDLERGAARIAERRPGAGDRQQRADPDLSRAGLRNRRRRTECEHGGEHDDREDAKHPAFYTTADEIAAGVYRGIRRKHRTMPLGASRALCRLRWAAPRADAIAWKSPVG